MIISRKSFYFYYFIDVNIKPIFNVIIYRKDVIRDILVIIMKLMRIINYRVEITPSLKIVCIYNCFIVMCRNNTVTKDPLIIMIFIEVKKNFLFLNWTV